ncbi:hypothetical protein D9M70_494020 [compost metagenome]
MKTEHDIARALRQVRESLRLVQTGLGLDQAYISRVERGGRTPTLPKIEEIAQQLGVHPLTILTVAYAESYGEWSALKKLVESQLKGVLIPEPEPKAKRKPKPKPKPPDKS